MYKSICINVYVYVSGTLLGSYIYINMHTANHNNNATYIAIIIYMYNFVNSLILINILIDIIRYATDKLCAFTCLGTGKSLYYIIIAATSWFYKDHLQCLLCMHACTVYIAT